MTVTEFGAISVAPPLLAIVLAILTRKAVLSLFLGIWSGAVIYTGGLGIVQTFEWIVAAVADEFHATIIVFTLLLGSGVAMVWNLGGTAAVRDWALKRLDSQRKAGLAAWGLGIVLFFDDYANTAIVGSAMKDVSDQLRISREKLSYIVDSTAAPVATLGISSWVAFQLSLIADGYESAGVDAANRPGTFEVFLASIPFNMYAILAIVMVVVIVGSGRDYGEMLSAEHRSWTTGKVTRDEAVPMQDVAGELGEPPASTPRLASFFIPVAVLIVVTLTTALWSGGFSVGGFAADIIAVDLGAAGERLWDAALGAAYEVALMIGSFAMVASGFLLGKAYGIFGVGDATEYTIDGFGIMLTAVSILVLAWGSARRSTRWAPVSTWRRWRSARSLRRCCPRSCSSWRASSPSRPVRRGGRWGSSHRSRSRSPGKSAAAAQQDTLSLRRWSASSSPVLSSVTTAHRYQIRRCYQRRSPGPT